MRLTRMFSAVLSLAVLCAATTAGAALEPRMPKKLGLGTERLALHLPSTERIPQELLLAATAATEEPAPEVGRMVGEYFAGVGLQLVGLVLAVIPAIVIADNGANLNEIEGATILWLLLNFLGAPALSSVGVWGIAEQSPDYTASYLYTWMGGVAGSGVAIGLAFAMAAGGSEADDVGIAAWLGMWLIPPLGEVIVANLTKTREGAGVAVRRPATVPVQPVEVLVRGEQPRDDRVTTLPLITLALP